MVSLPLTGRYGQLLRPDPDADLPKSFFFDGVLHLMPEEPKKPSKTIEFYEELNTFFLPNDSLEDMMRKLPAGTPLRDIRITSPGPDLRLKALVRKTRENIFYDEEMRVYQIELLAFEAAMKLWAVKVMAFRQSERARSEQQFEDALASKSMNEIAKATLHDTESREMTREWLQSLDKKPVDPTPDPNPKVAYVTEHETEEGSSITVTYVDDFDPSPPQREPDDS